MRYWLMKSEPSTYSIDDLASARDQTDYWDGVRNYQARNFMRDDMKMGDQAFFYNSNCKLPAIVGIMKIVREGYPDFTAFDPKDPHYDPGSSKENPRWCMVDVQYVRHLQRPLSLTELKTYPQLSELPLVKRGTRLSIMPVTKQQWQFILSCE